MMKRAHFSTILDPNVIDQLKIDAVMKHQTIADTLEQILNNYFEDRSTHSSTD